MRSAAHQDESPGFDTESIRPMARRLRLRNLFAVPSPRDGEGGSDGAFALLRRYLVELCQAGLRGVRHPDSIGGMLDHGAVSPFHVVVRSRLRHAVEVSFKVLAGEADALIRDVWVVRPARRLL